MNALLNWFDQRSGWISALRNYTGRTLPGGACWCKTLPCVIVFLFLVQAITGFFLWMHYSAGVQNAWESIYYLQHEVAGGWLLRALHHYGAQLLLVAAGIYLLQLVLGRQYRAPRELVFWCALLMVGLCLGSMLTGDLLRWDQNGCSATQVRVGFLDKLPGGGMLYRLVVGGPERMFGQLTLTRFLVIHICCMAGTFLVVLLCHGHFRRRAEAADAADAGQAAQQRAAGWADQAWRNGLACLVVLVVLLLVCCKHWFVGGQPGVELGSPAEPAGFYLAARPEWAFLGLYELNQVLSKYVPGVVPIFVIPGLIACVLVLMPWIGRKGAGHVFNVVFLLALLAGDVVLSVVSVARDRADPMFLAEVAAENQRARRAGELIQIRGGVPPAGALTLLKTDPKTRGPELFAQHCAACHAFTADVLALAAEEPAGEGKAQAPTAVKRDYKEIPVEKPTAPNLYGFATREWLAGLLDPEHVAGPHYFGNTKFRRGDMANAVKENLADLVEEEKQEIAALVAALSAEAQLPGQAKLDAKQQELVAEGREMFSMWGCTDCHRFHGEGTAAGPELTGYGSREWLRAIIADPTQKRFYGENNDRMPAYAASDDPAENLLSDQELDLLVDWLRGEWPRLKEKQAQ